MQNFLPASSASSILLPRYGTLVCIASFTAPRCLVVVAIVIFSRIIIGTLLRPTTLATTLVVG